MLCPDFGGKILIKIGIFFSVNATERSKDNGGFLECHHNEQGLTYFYFFVLFCFMVPNLLMALNSLW